MIWVICTLPEISLWSLKTEVSWCQKKPKTVWREQQMKLMCFLSASGRCPFSLSRVLLNLLSFAGNRSWPLMIPLLCKNRLCKSTSAHDLSLFLKLTNDKWKLTKKWLLLAWQILWKDFKFEWTHAPWNMARVPYYIRNCTALCRWLGMAANECKLAFYLTLSAFTLVKSFLSMPVYAFSVSHSYCQTLPGKHCRGTQRCLLAFSCINSP